MDASDEEHEAPYAEFWWDYRQRNDFVMSGDLGFDQKWLSKALSISGNWFWAEISAECNSLGSHRDLLVIMEVLSVWTKQKTTIVCTMQSECSLMYNKKWVQSEWEIASRGTKSLTTWVSLVLPGINVYWFDTLPCKPLHCCHNEWNIHKEALIYHVHSAKYNASCNLPHCYMESDTISYPHLT